MIQARSIRMLAVALLLAYLAIALAATWWAWSGRTEFVQRADNARRAPLVTATVAAADEELIIPVSATPVA